jgi:prepilin-type processing-associated H-X9-DG protein
LVRQSLQQPLPANGTGSFELHDPAGVPIRHPAMSQPIQVFGCPADGRTREPQRWLDLSVGLTSYLGVSGTNVFRKDGVLFADSQIRLHDIADGVSQTLLVGERPPYPNLGWGLWYTGLWGQKDGSCANLLGVREPDLLLGLPGHMDPYPGPSHFRPGSLSNLGDAFHYWSLHSGGANFLFADGSVRFLPYAADSILPALATRAAGDVIEGSDW